MTPRDRKLLTGLFALLAAAAVLKWLLLPALSEGQDLQEQIESAALQRQEQTSRLQTLDYIDEAISHHEGELEKLAKPYHTVLHAEEMDRMVTELFLLHGLEPRSLSVGDGAPGILRCFGSGETAATEETEYLRIASIQMTAGGTMESLLSLLDDLEENHPDLRMVSFDLGGDTIRCDLELYLRGK